MSTKAQIIATVGPPSGTADLVESMIRAGMDVARINFSHGTHETAGAYIAAIREAGNRLERKIPIIQDLSGPRGKTDDGHAFDEQQTVITEKDLSDLDFGLAQKVDYIAQSYVGSAADVKLMKGEIAKRGASTPVIAKIEKASGVETIGDILKVADAIMIARGDLGLALPYEDLPFVERDMIAACNAAGKPVIVATEMLYSMIERARPSRAEVTDIAYAILSGADAIMLSDETANGKHPVEAVAAMERIAIRAEKNATPRAMHLL